MTITTNTTNEQSTNGIPPQPTTLEQTSLDDSDVLQTLSLPTPPVSSIETVEPKLWLMRPPPFPPPSSSFPSSSSSSTIPSLEEAALIETSVLFDDLEQLVVNSTRNEETLLTGATTTTTTTTTTPSNTLPRSAAAIQIPNAPPVHLGDDDFTFEANDFILFDDGDDLGPTLPPTSPHSLFPFL